jgi:hypothetical protein
MRIDVVNVAERKKREVAEFLIALAPAKPKL